MVLPTGLEANIDGLAAGAAKIDGLVAAVAALEEQMDYPLVKPETAQLIEDATCIIMDQKKNQLALGSFLSCKGVLQP